MSPPQQNIAVNLARVRDDIADAATAAGRDPQSVRLVAVSKTRLVADIAAALAENQRDFGENYLQEALPKIETLSGCGACWHYIGRIQSNKTRELAAHFDWVQTVDRERIARRLSEQRPATLPPLNICLQVNIDREPQKAGADPGDIPGLAEAVRTLPQVRLRGLMAIPAANGDARRAFAALRELFEQLRAQGHELDTLSMGMSEDVQKAIQEGSTMVRIGTAIFGARD